MTNSREARTRYSHVAIGCTDFERSLEFYQALGFSISLRRVERSASMDDALSAAQGTSDRHVAYMQAGSGSETQFLSLCYREGQTGKPAKLDDIGLNHFAVWVDDMDEALAKMAAVGAKQLIPPFVAEGIGWTLPSDWQVRSTFVEDPDGVVVQLDQTLTGDDRVPEDEVLK